MWVGELGEAVACGMVIVRGYCGRLFRCSRLRLAVFVFGLAFLTASLAF
jgi:hypothetical protein